MHLRSTLAPLCAVLLLVAGAGRRASAQALPPFFSSIAVDPLGIPLLIADLEYQGDFGAGVTLGGDLSYVAPPGTNKRWTTLEAEGRYYPAGIPFKGFAVGVTAGITSFSNTTGPNGGRQSAAAATIGFAGDYNWLLGAQQRFLVGTGIGAKRMLGASSRLSQMGQNSAWPTARAVIGVLF